jgi:hypothetical protein
LPLRSILTSIARVHYYFGAWAQAGFGIHSRHFAALCHTESGSGYEFGPGVHATWGKKGPEWLTPPWHRIS